MRFTPACKPAPDAAENLVHAMPIGPEAPGTRHRYPPRGTEVRTGPALGVVRGSPYNLARIVPVNTDKPNRWKADIAASVDFYNQWFMNFAPQTYRNKRSEAAERVAHALEVTEHFTRLDADVLRLSPGLLPILRAATAPPLARDRLVGLASVNKSLVERMEKHGALAERMSMTSSMSNSGAWPT